jgi:guanylate kinase
MYSDTRKLIVFSAPSGSGKTTIVRHLLNDTDLPLAFSISATTRKPRPGEVDGKDYYFLSVEAFKERIADDAFVEWEEVYEGVLYGTLKTEIERIWNAHRAVVFDIDVEGGISIKQFFKEKALMVFVQPPSIEDLRNRLESRNTESHEQLEVRVNKASQELQKSTEFDTILINDQLEKALKEAEQIVAQFLSQ